MTQGGVEVVQHNGMGPHIDIIPLISSAKRSAGSCQSGLQPNFVDC